MKLAVFAVAILSSALTQAATVHICGHNVPDRKVTYSKESFSDMVLTAGALGKVHTCIDDNRPAMVVTSDDGIYAIIFDN